MIPSFCDFAALWGPLWDGFKLLEVGKHAVHDHSGIDLNSPAGFLGEQCCNCISAGTDYVNGFTPVFCVHLPQNPMDVISHGELRQIKARGDFLICQALGYEPDQLLLPQSKFRPHYWAPRGRFSGRFSDEPE